MGQEVTCPVCGSEAEGGHRVGDSMVVVCPHCGGYRLSGNALDKTRSGQSETSPSQFRDLVKKRRGDSDEYPLITSYDLV